MCGITQRRTMDMVDRCDKVINSCTNIDQLKLAKQYVERYVYIYDWGKRSREDVTYYINYLHCRLTIREKELQVTSL
jgi:hypothetical protein